MPDAVAEHEGGASAPRTGLLPILAASRIRYATKHDSRAGRASSAAPASRLARRRTRSSRSGGWPARRGHLRALAVALRPLPADPSHLVRGR